MNVSASRLLVVGENPTTIDLVASTGSNPGFRRVSTTNLGMASETDNAVLVQCLVGQARVLLGSKNGPWGQVTPQANHTVSAGESVVMEIYAGQNFTLCCESADGTAATVVIATGRDDKRQIANAAEMAIAAHRAGVKR